MTETPNNQIYYFEEDAYIGNTPKEEDQKKIAKDSITSTTTNSNTINEQNKINNRFTTEISRIPTSNFNRSSVDSSTSNDDEDIIRQKSAEDIKSYLLNSIKNRENPTFKKLQLANTINFKSSAGLIETDEFGFVKESKHANERFTIDNNKLKADKLLEINARMAKWSEMLKNYVKGKNTKQIKKRTRKGIPDGFRSCVWQLFGEIDKYKKPNLFQELDKVPNNKKIEEIIIKDLDRTFPTCELFMDKYGYGQRKLFRVLINYSKYNKEIEYVQGMGYIVALFLIYMDEESSFYLLHSLIKQYGLSGIYLPGFPDLRKKFYVLLNLEKKYIPNIYQVLKRDGVIPSIYASEWFICLFSKDFPFNILVRIFDTFLFEGEKIIYRFALAFLKLKEREFTNGEKGIGPTMRTISNCSKNIDEELLVKTAFSFRLPKRKIRNLEAEYEKCKDDVENEFIKQI